MFLLVNPKILKLDSENQAPQKVSFHKEDHFFGGRGGWKLEEASPFPAWSKISYEEELQRMIWFFFFLFA